MERAFAAVAEDVDDSATDTASYSVGTASESPINVVYIADTDFAHDQFFMFYRNQNDMLSEDNAKVLANLKNVQFIGNIVDALAGDEDFLTLRTARPQARPLVTIEREELILQERFRAIEESATAEAEQEIQSLQAGFQGDILAIQQRTDLDERAKSQLVAQVQRSAQHKLDRRIQAVNLEAARTIRQAQAESRRGSEALLFWIPIKAMLLPVILLGGLIVVVYARRIARERSVVPADRQRSAS